MNSLYMLVGVPGSGKSTWIQERPELWHPEMVENEVVILSSDRWVHKLCEDHGTNYHSGFQKFVKRAHQKMFEDLDRAIRNGCDIIWDQTNVNSKTRFDKLKKIPANYNKYAVVFEIPEKDELYRRLNSRPDQKIPEHVIESMILDFEYPTVIEGFDKIFLSTGEEL